MNLQNVKESINCRSHDTETFDTLLGDRQDQEQLPLENYKDGSGEASLKQRHYEEYHL